GDVVVAADRQEVDGVVGVVAEEVVVEEQGLPAAVELELVGEEHAALDHEAEVVAIVLVTEGVVALAVGADERREDVPAVALVAGVDGVEEQLVVGGLGAEDARLAAGLPVDAGADAEGVVRAAERGHVLELLPVAA